MNAARPRILILGAWGSFGRRIAQRLSRVRDCELLLAGRSAAAGAAFCASLQAAGAQAQLQVCTLDSADPDFAAQVAACAPGLLIHTAGPFQAQDYRVALAALACGAHYIDLADGREFVSGFADALDMQARAAGVTLLSGASSVPALSAAVVDALCADLAQIDTIDAMIAPGNRTERGAATVRAILGYVGAPMTVWSDGRWIRVRGWLGQRRWRFAAPVGVRWAGWCEVPDLSLFPARYPGVRRVSFRAGLEVRFMHFGLWLAAGLRRIGLVRSWARYTRPLLAMAEWLRERGSDAGVMRVEVQGRDALGRTLRRDWTLTALQGSGPEVPATAAGLLAEAWLQGAWPRQHGAGPCIGQIDLQTFESDFATRAIRCARTEQLLSG